MKEMYDIYIWLIYGAAFVALLGVWLASLVPMKRLEKELKEKE